MSRYRTLPHATATAAVFTAGRQRAFTAARLRRNAQDSVPHPNTGGVQEGRRGETEHGVD